MSAVTLMNNEENMTQDKEKTPSYDSSTICERIHHVVFAYYTGQLIKPFIIIFRYVMFPNQINTSQSVV